jgi:hypothetical protein
MILKILDGFNDLSLAASGIGIHFNSAMSDK